MSDQPTYIITGGAGFVGANLVAELLARQPAAHAVVIDNFRSGSFENIVQACTRRGVGPFSGSVIPCSTAALDWDMVVERHEPAVIFHLGTITDTTIANEEEMIRENVGGFDRLLAIIGESRRQGRPIRLVYASSAATYGTPPQAVRREPFPESAAGHPRNVYGFSKWLMEVAHRRAASKDDALPVVGLRYFNVFGPGEDRKGRMASMIFQLASRMLAGLPPRLFKNGEHTRDQIPVEDVVDATLAAAGMKPLRTLPPRPGVYNVGSGVPTTFNQIVESLRVSLDIPASRLPTEYFDMPESVRAFYQDFTLADVSAAAEGLNWKPTRPPLEWIGRYGSWLRAQTVGKRTP